MVDLYTKIIQTVTYGGLGDVMYFCFSEDDVDLQTKIMNCNVWWFISGACLVIGLIGLVVINVLHHKDGEPDYSVGQFLFPSL